MLHLLMFPLIPLFSGSNGISYFRFRQYHISLKPIKGVKL
nr:MAG TPA: hypothetical protein [Caudoviricetes sp.]